MIRFSPVACLLCGEVYTIGSAVRAGNALIAIHDGYEAALKL